MTKDEIVKALRACWLGFCGEKNLGAADLIEQQAARIEELEAKVPRWIPVTERLPEAKEGNWSGIAMVLVTVQPYCFLTDEPATPYVTSAAYDIEQRIFDVGGLGAVNAVLFESDKPRLTITHWMPLPEAAKEVYAWTEERTMELKQAFWILRHGSGEGLREYLKAIKTIEDNCVPVVRCEDCRYWQDNNGGYPNEECRWREDETPDADDFCSYGKRKDGDSNDS